jgi:DNA primase large subunit
MSLSEYPFTHQAADRVKETGYSLESLLERRSFQSVRTRALNRVLGAVSGEIPEERSRPLAEFLSYPLARAMVSCLDDDLLVRRYAMSEAKLASRMMKSEDLADLLLLANDLNVHPVKQNGLLELHFSEYLKAAHKMHSPHWKLVNRALKEGQVTVTREELMRLLEEMVRDRVMKGLPLKVPQDVCQKLEVYLVEVRQELEATRGNQAVDLGQVNEEAFPPCMVTLLKQVASGVNLAHTARFALTSFLLNVGMSVDDIVQVFNTSPDFDEERTRYQVEHISGKGGDSYTPPSCATMATYGNCPSGEGLCKWVNHPLNYYRRKIRKERSKRVENV